ncbi:glutaredoxin-1-like [Saccostrea cucullata]|uniref:glutaredoxin-1-like n=1 Tax=Saccostrea cuccullata TaxID=36930 RepID=UPI002ED0BA0F
MAGAKIFVDKKLAQGNVVVFSKSFSPECKLIKKILAEYNLKNLLYVDIESRQDCTQLENYLQILCQTDARSVPQLFIGTKYIGGEKELILMHESGKLKKVFEENK